MRVGHTRLVLRVLLVLACVVIGAPGVTRAQSRQERLVELARIIDEVQAARPLPP
ncbi:MAG: hypothetical protein ACOYOJ_21120 [Alsobacter sp.]